MCKCRKYLYEIKIKGVKGDKGKSFHSKDSAKKLKDIHLQWVEHASPGADHLLRLLFNREGTNEGGHLGKWFVFGN